MSAGPVQFHQFLRTPMRINLVTAAAAAYWHCVACGENDDDLMMTMLHDNLTRVRKTTSYLVKAHITPLHARCDV